MAAFCREELGGRLYSGALAKQVRDDDAPCPKPTQAVAATPFSDIVTIDYDKLLERAHRTTGAKPRAPTHHDTGMLGPLLFNGDSSILKAHGDVDRPETVVLTADDYRRVTHANEAFKWLCSLA